MKKYSFSLYLFIMVIFIWGCEDTIRPQLPDARPVTVIDAWIQNKPERQVIRLNKTIPYLNNQALPGIGGATVSIMDNEGKEYIFHESENMGEYEWFPDEQDTVFGKIGNEYVLTVRTGEEIYKAYSRMNRVPDIDSISFRFEKGNDFFPDAYFASFYATDPRGPGDTYWIQAFKNGKYLNKPSEINIAFDAGFNEGSLVDGITFVQPVREGINPFDQDENDDFIPPYEPGDSVYVEIHSITNESFDFLNEVKIQTDRPGGFGELFAQPLSNVPTNIEIETGTGKVIGFFNVSAVSSAGKRLDPKDLPK